MFPPPRNEFEEENMLMKYKISKLRSNEDKILRHKVPQIIRSKWTEFWEDDASRNEGSWNVGCQDEILATRNASCMIEITTIVRSMPPAISKTETHFRRYLSAEESSKKLQI